MIGRRPHAAFGNSTGDRQMLEYTQAGDGARLAMYLIAPDARTQAALLIRRARGDRSLAELARALETSWPSAQRLESPHRSPTLRQLEKAAAALGKRLVLALE